MWVLSSVNDWYFQLWLGTFSYDFGWLVIGHALIQNFNFDVSTFWEWQEMCWTKVHLNTFFLKEMFHHKVLDRGFRVSASAPASNPSGSVLEATPTSNPRDSSSTSLES